MEVNLSGAGAVELSVPVPAQLYLPRGQKGVEEEDLRQFLMHMNVFGGGEGAERGV